MPTHWRPSKPGCQATFHGALQRKILCELWEELVSLGDVRNY